MLSTEYEGNDFVLDDLSFRRLTENPLLPLSIHITTGGAAVELRWPSVIHQLYQVQWANEIDTHQWFSLGPASLGNGTTNSVVDPLGFNSQRFYRVIPVD